MPIYNYACPNCGNAEERVQTYAELQATRNAQTCSACGATLRYLFSAPAIQTSTTFLLGSDGFDNDKTRARAYREARAAGISCEGRRYSPQLARRGLRWRDPEAWISCKEDVQRVCQRRGLGCEGAVNVKLREPEEDPHAKPYRVADDIVEREVDRIVTQEAGGDATPSERNKLVEATRERLSPPDGVAC